MSTRHAASMRSGPGYLPYTRAGAWLASDSTIPSSVQLRSRPTYQHVDASARSVFQHEHPLSPDALRLRATLARRRTHRRRAETQRVRTRGGQYSQSGGSKGLTGHDAFRAVPRALTVGGKVARWQGMTGGGRSKAQGQGREVGPFRAGLYPIRMRA